MLNEAPDEHWTVAWREALPKMEFTLEVIPLDVICPNADLMSTERMATTGVVDSD
jgi:hypothetical protein